MEKASRTLHFKQNDERELNNESYEMIKKKLELKNEALLLLSEELARCRAQRDRYKIMVEHLQEKFVDANRRLNGFKELKRCDNWDDDFKRLDQLAEVQEQNRCLKLQVEILRQKLGDAQGNIKVLRTNNSSLCAKQQDASIAPSLHQREELIEQLEKMNLECSQLLTDLYTVHDEKHELEMERDAFKCKAHRLNHELSKALSATKPVDLDALINENRYLQERLQQLLEERELTRQSLSKYKNMLDSKRAKGTIKLGVNSAAGTIMTHKQVEQLLQQGANIPPQKSVAALSDLRCLCTALLEALNDKTLALTHQKKANKILALRICELNNVIQSPTMKLLEGYAGADVDLKNNSDFSDVDHISGCDTDSTAESNAPPSTDNKVKNTSFSLEGQVMQQIHSIQMSLPKNLSVLVQKALNNLKNNDKEKL